MKRIFFILITIAFICTSNIQAQIINDEENPSKFQQLFTPSETLNKKRFWALNSAFATGYTGVVIALNKVWYSQYPRSKFHTFNDWGEWEDMDKMGHLYTSYMESKLAANLYRWTGLDRKKSALAGFAIGTIFQTTLETLDAFSDEWGWSWGDVALNTAGGLTYLGQEFLWNEQRIQLKLSTWRRAPNSSPIFSTDGIYSTTLKERRNSLYGTNAGEVLLKDYNALTIWASVNVRSFMKKDKHWFPKWLNVAVGYGAENVYGGFDNIWTDEETNADYILDAEEFPRYRQIYFALDIDMTKIPVKNKFLKSLFSAMNIIKIPAPALELNTLGKIKFHPLHF